MRTLQEWEHGWHKPSRTAPTLLAMAKQHLQVLREPGPAWANQVEIPCTSRIAGRQTSAWKSERMGVLYSAEPRLILVPPVGIELTTYRLQGGCSTN